MNRRNVFGGEHMGPIYGSSHIWAPYIKRRKALIAVRKAPPPAPAPAPTAAKKVLLLILSKNKKEDIFEILQKIFWI